MLIHDYNVHFSRSASKIEWELPKIHTEIFTDEIAWCFGLASKYPVWDRKAHGGIDEMRLTEVLTAELGWWVGTWGS